jgi:hypothetical protein
MSAQRRLAALAAVAALGVGVAGCSSSSAPSEAPPQTATTTTPAPIVTPSSALGPLAPPTLSAVDVSDPGLPSHVGPGKLSTPTIKRLVQYFEDKVSKAYADGDSAALDHYLAGPMLSGNRATINLLNSQHKRNVFRIRVESITPETNEAHSVIVDMTGDMVLDYFVDTDTHKVLNNGLPGPSQLQFAIFLNENPKTHTWYWTGEQSETTGSTTGGSQ